MRSWLTTLVLAALALLLVPGHPRAEAAPNPIPVAADDASWGSRNAPVTLVVFTDFQCPFCGRLNDTLEELRKDFGAAQLRIVAKHFPLAFHQEARPAAEAAVAVRSLYGDERFWEFGAAAFPTLSKRKGDWKTVARQLGLSTSRLQQVIDGGAPARQVEADVKLGQSIGVRGTPASFVNGIALSGARPKADFAEVITEQLTAAKAKRAAGVPASRVSAQLTAENFTKPTPRGSRAKRPSPADDKTIWHVPVGTSPTQGPATALVTVVTFAEFQCPFCGRLQPTLQSLRAKFGGDLRLVFKHNPLPFHKRAEPAAHFTAEAFAQRGDRGFWEAHDLLFQHMRELEDDDLRGYAAQLRLDPARTMSAVQRRAHQATIDADAALARQVEARGTPTSFVNGRKVAGAQPLDVFETVVKQELARARDLRRKGVPAHRVYDEAIRQGRGGPSATP